MDQVIQNRENFTRELAARWIANRPSAVMKRKEDRLRGLGERQVRALSGGLEKKESSLVRLQSLLKALGPESAFERGFYIMMDEDGKVVKEADTVKKGQRRETIMKGGVVTSVAD
jgi:exonuclease VII large subunit